MIHKDTEKEIKEYVFGGSDENAGKKVKDGIGFDFGIFYFKGDVEKNFTDNRILEERVGGRMMEGRLEELEELGVWLVNNGITDKKSFVALRGYLEIRIKHLKQSLLKDKE